MVTICFHIHGMPDSPDDNIVCRCSRSVFYGDGMARHRTRVHLVQRLGNFFLRPMKHVVARILQKDLDLNEPITGVH